MDDQISGSILANFGVNADDQLQTEEKNNTTSPLKNIDSAPYNFITVSNKDQEFIDHSLLSPEYITAQLNLVDFVGNSESNVINENINNDLEYRSDDQEKRLTAAILQIVNRQYEDKGGNEVSSNKELNTITSSSDHSKQINLDHNFLSSLLHDNQFKICQQVQTQHNMADYPPLPPLTPISRRNSNISKQSMTKDDFGNSRSIYRNQADNIDVINSKLQRPLAKKNLPHKKRITKKLKNIEKSVQRGNIIYSEDDVADEENILMRTQFSCQICGAISDSQIDFFSHLKQHYEPILNEIDSTTDKNNSCLQNSSDITQFQAFQNSNINEQKNHIKTHIDNENASISSDRADDIQSGEVEFSDTEDMLEGIRGVVDKVQASENDSTDIDMIDDKNWFGNNTLSNGINLKNDIHSVTAQNLCTSVDNFESFFKNELEKNTETEQNILRSHLVTQIGNVNNEFIKADNIILENNISTSETETTFKQNNTNKNLHIEQKSDVENINNKRVNNLLRLPRSCQRKQTILESDDDDNDTFETSSICENKSNNENKIKFKQKIKCPKCGKLFNSTNALKYHNLSHTGERPHQCEICGNSFYALSALKVHMRVHSGVKPYECEFCKRAFRQWGDLKYHTISIHTNEKNYQCEFCGKAFARRYSLVIHRRIHTSERNYKCEFCPKTFRASSYLQNHRKVHTGERPYICKICNKKFRVSGDLKRHAIVHNREKKKKTNSKVLKVENISETNNTVVTNKTHQQETAIGNNNNQVKRETTDFIENECNGVLYSNGQIDIFKAELNLSSSSSNINELSKNKTSKNKTQLNTIKDKIFKKIKNKNSDMPINSETEKTEEMNVEDEILPVDLVKFLPKGNLLYFW